MSNLFLKKPVPKTKRYWKVYDLFIRTFKWPMKLHLKKKEQTNIKLNYSESFCNLMRLLKKELNLTDEEVSNFDNFESEYNIVRLEKTKYNNKILSQIYKETFDKNKLGWFVDATEYVLKYISDFEKEVKVEEDGAFIYHQYRVLKNILLGICFEYVCKTLVLSKGYCINQNSEKKPVKKLSVRLKIDPTKTLSLGDVWNFILKKRIIKLAKEEKIIGNYLLFLRNVSSHIPMPPASRAIYNLKAIDLIKKMLRDAKNEYIYYLGGKK